MLCYLLVSPHASVILCTNYNLPIYPQKNNSKKHFSFHIIYYKTAKGDKKKKKSASLFSQLFLIKSVTQHQIKAIIFACDHKKQLKNRKGHNCHLGKNWQQNSWCFAPPTWCGRREITPVCHGWYPDPTAVMEQRWQRAKSLHIFCTWTLKGVDIPLLHIVAPDPLLVTWPIQCPEAMRAQCLQWCLLFPLSPWPQCLHWKLHPIEV